MANTEFFEQFGKGCWVRGILNPQNEKKILLKRESLTRQQLLGHNNRDDRNYTNYSPCTFIKQGLPVSLFPTTNEKAVTVIIRPSTYPINWWYDGSGNEVLSNNLQFIPNEPINHIHADPKAQYINTTVNRISKALDKLYKKSREDNESSGEDITLSWNEGLIRYKKEDIIGFIIAPTKKSFIHALNFRQRLEINPINVGFYEYNDQNGTLEQHRSIDLSIKYDLEGGPLTVRKIITKFFNDLSVPHITPMLIRNLFTHSGFNDPIYTFKKDSAYPHIFSWEREMLDKNNIELLLTIWIRNNRRDEDWANIALYSRSNMDKLNEKTVSIECGEKALEAIYNLMLYPPEIENLTIEPGFKRL